MINIKINNTRGKLRELHCQTAIKCRIQLFYLMTIYLSKWLDWLKTWLDAQDKISLIKRLMTPLKREEDKMLGETKPVTRAEFARWLFNLLN